MVEALPFFLDVFSARLFYEKRYSTTSRSNCCRCGRVWPTTETLPRHVCRVETLQWLFTLDARIEVLPSKNVCTRYLLSRMQFHMFERHTWNQGRTFVVCLGTNCVWFGHYWGFVTGKEEGSCQGGRHKKVICCCPKNTKNYQLSHEK